MMMTIKSEWSWRLRQCYQNQVCQRLIEHSVWVWVMFGVAVFSVFAITGSFEFISYDDPVYVTSNREIAAGITGHGLRWALTGVGETNLWHPLTWLSHMVDVAVFGVGRPGMHHLVNAFWHALAAVGFGLVLSRLTGDGWLALLLAGLWAVHPQRVQSVAWISERKDVLSGAWCFFSWWAWEHWREKGSRSWYGMSLGMFILAALAKPSVVPLPLVLAWCEIVRNRRDWPLLRRRILWLVPFGVISLLVAGLTIYFQKSGALGQLGDVMMTPARRMALMPVSLWWYLKQWLLPYPGMLWVYPPGLSFWRLAVPVMGLVFVSVALWRIWGRSHIIMMGVGVFVLFWLPVSGFVPVSFYYVADRYSYLIQVGLFIGLAGWIQILGGRLRPVLLGAGACVAVAMLIISLGRLTYWKNSETLFSHERVINPRSLLAPIHLGVEMERRGDFQSALAQFQDAMKIDESSGLAATGAGRTLEKLGRHAEALQAFREAGKKPILHHPDPFILGAAAAMRNGDAELAKSFLDDGMLRFPHSAQLLANQGALAQTRGFSQEALVWYDRALVEQPTHGDAMQGKGVALIELNRVDEGLAMLRKLLELEPGREAVRRVLTEASRVK